MVSIQAYTLENVTLLVSSKYCLFIQLPGAVLGCLDFSQERGFEANFSPISL